MVAYACFALVVASSIVLTPSSARAQTVRLNGDLARSVVGDVRVSSAPASMSSDGAWFVFVANTVSGSQSELFAVSPAGGPPHQLSLADTSLATDPSAYSLSPDGARVVFLATDVVSSQASLYSAPLDGSTAAIQLGTVSPAAEVSLVLGPDSSTAAFRTQGELRVVPVGGGAVLSLASGVTVDSFAFAAERVLFRRFPDLWSVPRDGSAAATPLSSLPTSSRVTSYRVAPAGPNVVYLANTGGPSSFELFCAPYDAGAAAVRVSGTLVAGGTVEEDYAIDATGTRVVYRADQLTLDRTELFVADLPDGANNFRLNAPVGPFNPVAEFLIDPLGTRVVYRAGTTLYSVPLDASAPALALATQATEFDVSPDASFVLCTRTTSQVLWRIPIDASAPGLALSPAGLLCQSPFRLSPDLSTLTFLAVPDGGNVQLYEVPTDGSLTATRLNAPFDEPHQVTKFALVPDGSRAVYLADQELDETFELYGVPAHGASAPVKLSGPLALSDTIGGDVHEMVISADGAWVIYQSEQDEVGKASLHAAHTDGSAPAVRLHDLLPGVGVGFDAQISHDSARVFYRQDDDGTIELYGVPIDRSSAPVKLSGTMVPGGFVDSPQLLTSDDASLLFCASANAVDAYELFSVPSDGSAAPTRLHPPLPSGEDVWEWQFSTDEANALFLSGAGEASLGLYTVPLDASAAPQLLSGPMIAGGGVHPGCVATATGWVVYEADEHVNGRYELFAAPQDGSGPEVQLSGPILAGGDVITHTASANGERALYLADAQVDEVYEVFCAPVDGSAPAVRVNAPLAPDRDVTQARIDPSGTRVAYIADVNTNQKFALYSAAADGSGGIRLSDPALTAVLGCAITLDGERVLFFARTGQGVNLYGVPLDGSAAAVRLSANVTEVASFILHPSGQVLFAARASETEPYQLFCVREDGRLPARRVSPDWPGSVLYLPSYNAPYRLTPAADRAIYLADRLGGGVYELFGTQLRGKVRASSPPGTTVVLGGIVPAVADGADGSSAAPRPSLARSHEERDGRRSARVGLTWPRGHRSEQAESIVVPLDVHALAALASPKSDDAHEGAPGGGVTLPSRIPE